MVPCLSPSTPLLVISYHYGALIRHLSHRRSITQGRQITSSGQSGGSVTSNQPLASGQTTLKDQKGDSTTPTTKNGSLALAKSFESSRTTLNLSK